VRVSELSALQVPTVVACVNIISDAISALPFNVFEHVAEDGREGKKKARNHPLFSLLNLEPNSEMTINSLLKVMMVHALLWGNSFVEIEHSKADNSITNLWPRQPHKTRAIRVLQPFMLEGDLLRRGTLLFETTDGYRGGDMIEDENSALQLGLRRFILAEDMIHVHGLTLDGRVGLSTTWNSRQAVGLSLAAEKYAAKFFGNGARPAGVLTFPNKQDDDVIENIRRSWAEGHGGENTHKVAILEEGVKFEKIAATPNEGQLLETRQFQRAELCAIFKVPLHMVGAMDKGQGGKSNIEQNSLEFLMYCLDPWITKIEQEFKRKLFPKMGRTAGKFFPKFDVSKLRYPDAETRSKFYAAGRQWGFLNGDDIREMEDMNPIADGSGKPYWMPITEQDAADPATGLTNVLRLRKPTKQVVWHCKTVPSNMLWT